MLRWCKSLDPFVWVLVAVGIAARIIMVIAGVHVDARALPSWRPVADQWQMLDTGLLRHDLWSSIWHLHMQPPLYNAAFGLLLAAPTAWQLVLVGVTMFGLYLVTVLASYGTMTELGLSRRVAFVVVLVVVALNPAELAFETVLFYVTPTAALLTLFGYLVVRLLRQPSGLRSALAFGVAAVTALVNSSFQPFFVMALFGVVVVAGVRGAARRAVLLGGAGPILVLVGWMVRTFVLFGLVTTSSWLGMNLSRSTTSAAPLGVIRTMVADGQLSRLALIGPFEPLGAYGIRSRPGNVPALSAPTKVDGAANLNNTAYIGLADQFLHDDLRFIELRPDLFAHQVGRSLSIWFVTADQFPPFNFHTGGPWGLIHLYDRVVMLEPQPDRFVGFVAVIDRHGPSWLQVSWLEVIEWLLVLGGTPIVVLRWWRRRRPEAVALVVLLVVSLEWLVVTSVTELGENNRFNFELGTIPLTLACVVLSAVLRAWRARRGPSARSVGEVEAGADRSLERPGATR